KVGQQTNSKITSFEDTGLSQLFLDLKDDFYLKSFYRNHLDPILTIENPKRKELLTTLKMFLECNLNFKETAEALYLHPNTVRYRIEQITEIDKDYYLFVKSDKRFHIYLSLKLMDVLFE